MELWALIHRAVTSPNAPGPLPVKGARTKGKGARVRRLAVAVELALWSWPAEASG